MDSQGTEFQDWEVLPHNSDTDSEPLISDVAEFQESSDFVHGMIQTNYFSLDSPRKNMVVDDSEVSSKTSDNPSWIDPAFETQYQTKHSAEAWPDSSSDLSDDKRFSEFEGKSDVGFVENDQNGIFHEGFDGVEHMVTGSGVSSGELIDEGVEGSGELGVNKDGILGEEKCEGETSEVKGETEVSKVEEKGKKSGMVWWKFPIELLRYCVFKGPVWTVSVAAAFMGFVILGRRLYKMKKKKSMDLRPRITMDDKKISQFMSRAARLNEAFSVVKRVPLIRPSLPAAGVSPWPVVSLR